MMENYKKEAAPGATNTESGKAEMGSASKHTTISPAFECTTIASSGQALKISGLLSHGAENGVTLRHLEKLTDLPGREVRRQIERERRRGIPILSDNMSGYFLPSSEDEKARCVRSMRGRAREILRTAQAIEEAADISGGDT